MFLLDMAPSNERNSSKASTLATGDAEKNELRAAIRYAFEQARGFTQKDMKSTLVDICAALVRGEFVEPLVNVDGDA